MVILTMAEADLKFLDQVGTVGPRISNELEKLNIQKADSENFDLRWTKFSRMPQNDLWKNELWWTLYSWMIRYDLSPRFNELNLTSGKLNDPKWPDDENWTSGELRILE